MHRFLRLPCLEALLAGFGGAGVGDDLALWAKRVWEGESGGCEGEEEDEEGLGKVGEVHGWLLGCLLRWDGLIWSRVLRRRWWACCRGGRVGRRVGIWETTGCGGQRLSHLGVIERGRFLRQDAMLNEERLKPTVWPVL